MDKAVAIGVFDGVHRGHLHLLQTLKAESAAHGLEPVALTFNVHPMALVNPDAMPASICRMSERLERIQATGVRVWVMDFTPQLRSLTATEFLTLLSEQGVRLLLMGFNNRIGSDRVAATDPALARAAGHVGITIVEATEAATHVSVSSSAVRKAVTEGQMELAAEMLGRPFALTGRVVEGKQLGRTLGFPTANIAVPACALMPKPGVYAGEALGHKAVINIGRRPTVDPAGAPLSVEVHLIDFSANLYGSELRVELTHRLRDEMKFTDLDQLKAQINKDADDARNL